MKLSFAFPLLAYAALMRPLCCSYFLFYKNKNPLRNRVSRALGKNLQLFLELALKHLLPCPPRCALAYASDRSLMVAYASDRISGPNRECLSPSLSMCLRRLRY
jgi:hypothetical protein